MRFHKVNIEITNICNLRCSFCPEVMRPKQMMTLQLFKKIIPVVTPLTDQVCLHLMGEPLAHPQFEEFIKVCEEHHTPIFLVSNGVLLERKKEFLFSKAIRQVNFSLHSFLDNFPDQDFSNYLKAIFEFTEKVLLTQPEKYINFRLWNLQSTQSVHKKNKEMLQAVLQKFLTSEQAQILEEQLLRGMNLKKQKSYRLKGRLYLHFDTEFTWPSLDLPELGDRGTCYGLRSHFGILVDGTVVPCCLDHQGVMPLGNLQEQNLLEILNSPRAKKIVQGFLNHQLTEDLCKRCQYIQRFS